MVFFTEAQINHVRQDLILKNLLRCIYWYITCVWRIFFMKMQCLFSLLICRQKKICTMLILKNVHLKLAKRIASDRSSQMLLNENYKLISLCSICLHRVYMQILLKYATEYEDETYTLTQLSHECKNMMFSSLCSKFINTNGDNKTSCQMILQGLMSQFQLKKTQGK